MTENQNETTVASQWTEEAPPATDTTVEEYNPYLDELKKLINNAKLAAEMKPYVGFPERIRKVRRAKNYRARESRRINRFLAKGKHV